MKLKLILVFLSLVLLTACSKEDVESPLPTQREALQLSVSATDFVTNGADTRIEDDGKETVFERGDRVGVIVLEGTTLKANNLPYVYDGTKWSFDTETATTENKNIYYYDSKATNYNPQNHPDEFLKRNGSAFFGGLKRSGSISSKNE